MKARNKRRIHPVYVVIIAVAFAWFFLIRFACETNGSMNLYLMLWSAVSAFCTGVLLVWLDYFKPFRPISGVSDSLSLYLSVPVPAIFFKYLIFVFIGRNIARDRIIVELALPVSVFVFIMRNLVEELFSRYGRKLHLVLRVLPEEREQLDEVLRREGVRRHFSLANESEGYSHADTIVISRSVVQDLVADQKLLHAHLAGVSIIDFKSLLKELEGRIIMRHSDAYSYLLAASPKTAGVRLYFLSKTYFERPLALVALILLLPVLLVIAIIIKFSSSGPVIYRQVRTGYRGKTFLLLKFRTMGIDAEESGPKWASKSDRRVTPLGRFLRSSRLDELPQLVNVIKGDLSIIGPRPERPEFYESLREEIPLFTIRTLVRPGITGWAQVRLGYTSTVAEAKRKIEYDLFYIQHMSPRLDLSIFGRTVKLLLAGGGGR